MLLDASAWHTVSYNNLSYFANLRPKDCVRANSRCIFGVELKTRAEKAHDTQNLKVWDFFFRRKICHAGTGLNSPPFLQRSVFVEISAGPYSRVVMFI